MPDDSEQMRATLAKVRRALACRYVFEEPGHVVSTRQEDAQEVCDALGTALGRVEAAEPYKAMMEALAEIDHGKPLMALTERLVEHPEGYEGPCLCALCRSYA